LTAAYAGEVEANSIAHVVIQSAKNARPANSIEIVSFDKVIMAGYNHIEKRAESKKKVYGVPTGISELDDLTDGIYPGESWLVAGRPGKGKTAFQMGMSKYAASQGFRVGLVNLEMGNEQLGIRSLSAKANLPITMLRKGLISEERHWAALGNAAGELSSLPIYVCSTAFTTEQIEHATDRLIDDFGCQLIIYDYVQIIRPGHKSKDRNREQEVAEISRMIKHKAMQSHFAAMPLAQLNRETDKRKDKRPQMSDLRESGALENDADNIILIHHLECNCPWGVECSCGNRDRVDLIVDKGRNCGTGVVETVWDRFTASFKSKNPEPEYVENNRYGN
jgi:replicative DNA helicase